MPEIIIKLVELAKAGDTAAAKILLDRVCPTLKPQAMPISLPVNGTLAEQGGEIIRATMAGQIPPDIGSQLIAAFQLVNGFHNEHAIIVRPFDGKYQIISGHHRHKACLKAGITQVPAWVKEMDDDTAYMQLLLCNSQGEVSKLERGIHAYNFITKSKGGNGSSGMGLSEYAKLIGTSKQTASEESLAGEVFSTVRMTGQLNEMPSSSHLYEISKAPQHTWQILADLLIQCDWSAKDTQAAVNRPPLPEYYINPFFSEMRPP